MPVVTVVMAVISHLRIRRFMINLSVLSMCLVRCRLRRVAQSRPVAVMPAWAAVGSQMKMPVVMVVIAMTSHLRMRRMFHLPNVLMSIRYF
jgi:hypothetical protein